MSETEKLLCKAVVDLCRELDYAYQGLRTIPADHRARVVYDAAQLLLEKVDES